MNVNEAQRTCLMVWMIGVGVMIIGILAFVWRIDRDQRTDNQTMAVLRAQNAELKRNLQDTEEALDKAALEGSRLGQEIEVLRYDLERATKRPRL